MDKNIEAEAEANDDGATTLRRSLPGTAGDADEAPSPMRTRGFEPIHPSPDDLATSLSRGSHPSRRIVRVISQNGYGVTDDENGGHDSQEKVTERDRYEVGFDGGDRDPVCPRSFPKWRKWLITLIVSNCSFAV